MSKVFDTKDGQKYTGCMQKQQTNMEQRLNYSFVESLEKLGLSRNEARVYTALLMLGRGTVSKITRLAGLNRTTGYDLLESLVLKNLVRISGKEPKQEYVAESPDKLQKFTETQLEQQEHRVQDAKKLIPQLKSLQPVYDRPQIKFYEGKKGLKEVYEDTLTSTETIRAYAAVDDVHNALPKYFPGYYKRRARKGIPIRAIFPDTEVSRARRREDKAEKRESVLIPFDEYSFSPEINIYDNKIMIASWREELGIIIESKEIADAMKKIYELAWTEAKRLDNKINKSTND